VISVLIDNYRFYVSMAYPYRMCQMGEPGLLVNGRLCFGMQCELFDGMAIVIFN